MTKVLHQVLQCICVRNMLAGTGGGMCRPGDALWYKLQSKLRHEVEEAASSAAAASTCRLISHDKDDMLSVLMLRYTATASFFVCAACCYMHVEKAQSFLGTSRCHKVMLLLTPQ